jgi:hypothetical protein
MLVSKIFFFYSEKHTKHINIFMRQNMELLAINVCSRPKCSYVYVVNGSVTVLYRVIQRSSAVPKDIGVEII